VSPTLLALEVCGVLAFVLALLMMLR